MKKVLFTTTALVAFAGAASAEIAITGMAEMGIIGGSGAETQFHEDVDVTFTMTGETDGGLSFGVAVDLDEAAGLGDATANNGTAAWISGSFGRITLGNTDGAMDWALTEAANVAGNPGSINDDEDSHAGYMGSYLDGAYDGQVLRYDNTFGAFGVAISAEIDDVGTAGVSNGYAIGLRYNLDLGGTTVALGLGHQVVDVTALAGSAAADRRFEGLVVGSGVSMTGVSAAATFTGGFSAGIVYSTLSVDAPDVATAAGVAGVSDGDHIGIGFGYESGAFSAHLNYGEFDFDNAAVADQSGYGLALGYDLGGGASVLAGYGSSKVGAAPTTSTWSLGLAFEF